jgi:hypothetical protein
VGSQRRARGGKAGGGALGLLVLVRVEPRRNAARRHVGHRTVRVWLAPAMPLEAAAEVDAEAQEVAQVREEVARVREETGTALAQMRAEMTLMREEIARLLQRVAGAGADNGGSGGGDGGDGGAGGGTGGGGGGGPDRVKREPGTTVNKRQKTG